MPHSDIRDSKVEPANGGRKPSDKRLLDLVQRQTFRHSGELFTPSAGWRATRQGLADPMDDAVAIGGSGFGVVAILVAARAAAILVTVAELSRLARC